MPFDHVTQTQAEKNLVEMLADASRRPDYAINPNQVFENLNMDPQIPDHPVAVPASRRQLLNELLNRNPGTIEDVKQVLFEFCRAHPKEGIEKPECRSFILGRVWTFNRMAFVLQKKGITWNEAVQDLRNMIANLAVEDQRIELSETPISTAPIMWAFHDPASQSNPFANITRSRSVLVNRLGLGHYDQGVDKATELICWGHRLQTSKTAHSPTAWDANDSPYWRPGGVTFPLDNNASQGLPEVVHDQLTGDSLVIQMNYATV